MNDRRKKKFPVPKKIREALKRKEPLFLISPTEQMHKLLETKNELDVKWRCRTFRRIYERLEKGPLCLEDYGSTGLGRTTVSKACKFLEEKEMVKRERQGHKIPYLLNEQKDFIDWVPYIFSVEEIRELTKRPNEDLREWTKITMNSYRPRIRAIGHLETLYRKDQKHLIGDQEIGDRTIIDLIIEAEPNLTQLRILIIRALFLKHMICRECLLESKEIALVKDDLASGESICLRTGLVIEK